MNNIFKEIDVSDVYPERYNSTKVCEGEVTPSRGKDLYVTIIRETPFTESEVLLAAEVHLKSVLYAFGVVIEDVIFTPADTLSHCNKEGKPVAVFLEEGVRRGEYVYEFETRFKLLK